MTKSANAKDISNIDYNEMMFQTLQAILDLQDEDDVKNWYKGIANLMRFGRNYSAGNLLLVHAQKKAAIWTEGFRAWRNKYRRSVQKGEKGILIFAPVVLNVKRSVFIKPDTDSDPDQKPASKQTVERETQMLRFKPVYVWDYSQTTGDPVPEIETLLEKRKDVKKRFYGTMDEKRETVSLAMMQLIRNKGINVVFRDMGTAGGMAHGKTLYIDYVFEGGSALGVMIHEYAHIMLGHTANQKCRAEMELEAELTVGLVKSGLGLDFQQQAAYLHSWSRDADPDTRADMFMNAFKYSQPLAGDILNYLDVVNATTDVEEMNAA